MNAVIRTPESRLMVFGGRGNTELAHSVATQLGTELTPMSAYDFANGEIFVRFHESVRGCDAFVIQSHCDNINTAIMEQLIMVDALKRASAERITVVVEHDRRRRIAAPSSASRESITLVSSRWQRGHRIARHASGAAHGRLSV